VSQVAIAPELDSRRMFDSDNHIEGSSIERYSQGA